MKRVLDPGNTANVASRRNVLKASMLASAVGVAAKPLLSQTSGALREYWIQVDSMPHCLVPTQVDAMSGTAYAPSTCSIGALVYRAFSPNWATLLPGDNSIGPNTGFPGPTIRADVGDTIRVHFRNNDTHYRFPHSIHAHGLVYTPEHDGAWIWAHRNTNPGAAVPYGDSFTYEYSAGPDSVGTWPYHDHSIPQTLFPGTDPIMELNAELGMMGIIAVTEASTPSPDVEHVLIMHDIYASDLPGLSQDFDCFNGYSYLGNTPTFRAQTGQRVRWRIMTLGREFHAFHIHGHRWRQGDGAYYDTQVMGPATTLTVEYVEQHPGTWLYHCHVVDHMMGGMMGYYVVS